MRQPLKFACLMALWLFSAAAHGAQPDLIKLTVGYSPISVSFLRAMNEGLHLAKTDAVASKKALRRYTRVQDEATLQGTFEFFQPYFPANLRTIEKAMANAIKFLDHPKAKQLDPKQTFNNSYVDEALK